MAKMFNVRYVQLTDKSDYVVSEILRQEKIIQMVDAGKFLIVARHGTNKTVLKRIAKALEFKSGMDRHVEAHQKAFEA